MEIAIIGALMALGAFGLYRMRIENGGGASYPPQLVKKLGKVAMIGDSLAVGLRKQIFVRAEKDLISIDYQSIGGTTTGEWLDKLPNLHGVDAFVVVLGTNDAGGSGKSFRGNMLTILDHAAPSVPVVWVQPTGTHLKGYDRVMAEIETSLADGDIAVLVDSPEDGYASDNMHLSPDAYRQWADRIWDTLTGGEQDANGTDRHS